MNCLLWPIVLIYTQVTWFKSRLVSHNYLKSITYLCRWNNLYKRYYQNMESSEAPELTSIRPKPKFCICVMWSSRYVKLKNVYKILWLDLGGAQDSRHSILNLSLILISKWFRWLWFVLPILTIQNSSDKWMTNIIEKLFLNSP